MGVEPERVVAAQQRHPLRRSALRHHRGASAEAGHFDYHIHSPPALLHDRRHALTDYRLPGYRDIAPLTSGAIPLGNDFLECSALPDLNPVTGDIVLLKGEASSMSNSPRAFSWRRGAALGFF